MPNVKAPVTGIPAGAQVDLVLRYPLQQLDVQGVPAPEYRLRSTDGGLTFIDLATGLAPDVPAVTEGGPYPERVEAQLTVLHAGRSRTATMYALPVQDGDGVFDLSKPAELVGWVAGPEFEGLRSATQAATVQAQAAADSVTAATLDLTAERAAVADAVAGVAPAVEAGLAPVAPALADIAQSSALASAAAGITPRANLAAITGADGYYRAMDTGYVYQRETVNNITTNTRRPDLEALNTEAIGYIRPAAAADGVMDDSAALSAAIDEAITTGRVLDLKPHATYKLNTSVLKIMEGTANLIIEGNGAVLDITDMAANKPALDFRGSVTQSVTTITANIARQSKTVTVASAAGLAVGDLIVIRSMTEVFDADRAAEYTKGELARIAAISGTTLTLDGGTYDSYLSSGDVRVDVVRPIRNIRIRGLTIRGTQAKTQIGVMFRYFAGASVEGCTVQDCRMYGVYATTGIGLSVTGGNIAGCLDTVVGYGVIAYGTDGVIVQGTQFDECRHAVDMSGGGGVGSLTAITRNVSITACIATRCISAGLSTHGGSELVVIANNNVADCGGGIHTRSGRTTVANNTISGYRATAQSYQWAIGVGDKGPNFGDGNGGFHYSAFGNTVSGAFANGMYVTAPLINAKIEDNRWAGHTSFGVLVEARRHRDVTFAGNTVDGAGFVATFDGNGNQTNAFTHGFLIRSMTDGTGSTPDFDGLFIYRNTFTNTAHTAMKLELGKSAGVAARGVDVSNNYITGGIRGVELTNFSVGTRLSGNVTPDLPLALTGGKQAFVFSTANHTLSKSELNYTSEGWQTGGGAPVPVYTAQQDSTAQFSAAIFQLNHTGNAVGQRVLNFMLEKNTAGGDGVVRLRQFLASGQQDWIVLNLAANIMYLPLRTEVQTRLDVTGVYVSKASAGQSISSAGSVILANAATVQITSGSSSYTLSSTPTIAAGIDGQDVLILNFGTGTITLQDEATLAGSLLRLSAPTVALGPGQTIRLRWFGVIGRWKQISAVI